MRRGEPICLPAGYWLAVTLMVLSNRAKTALLIAPFAVVGFLLEGPAPIGRLLWPPAEMPVTPTQAQMLALMGTGVVEAIGFGIGCAFLIQAYPAVRRAAGSKALAVASYISIGWLLVNWVPHDSLHMHIGMDINGLIALEYGFHATLILAAAVTSVFAMRMWRSASASQSNARAAGAPRRVEAPLASTVRRS